MNAEDEGTEREIRLKNQMPLLDYRWRWPYEQSAKRMWIYYGEKGFDHGKDNQDCGVFYGIDAAGAVDLRRHLCFRRRSHGMWLLNIIARSN